MSEIPLTVIKYTDFNGRAKNVFKTEGGMIPYDLGIQHPKDPSTGKAFFEKLFGDLVKVFMWSNGNLKVVILGKEFRAYPSVIRPTASLVQQTELPLEPTDFAG